MILYDGERLDYVNDKIELIQKSEGLTFGTDALLLAGYINGKYKNGIELGSGSGIISMLLLTRGKLGRCTAIEVQEEYAELTRRNAEHNSLGAVLTSVHADIREYKPEAPAEIVFSNPPYMKADSGRANLSKKKNAARHEVHGSIEDFSKSGASMLKYGGVFAVVYRPDRLCDLICAMRSSGVEPKRLTFVHADSGAVPSMVLCEGKRGGKSGVKLTRPLIIYTDSEHTSYTEDMNYIMENGSFPADFGS